MKYLTSKKRYTKESVEVKTAVRKSLIDLDKIITTYSKEQIPFEKIFDNDKVKYDQHGRFFTYKCEKNRLQLRILYAYLIDGKEESIIVYDYFIKKKNKKTYISQFSEAKNIDPMEVYYNARLYAI